MLYETLIVELEDEVALVTLNRPTALNALNSRMMEELCDLLKSLEQDERARCIIITGSERAFAAGADISEMAGKSFVEVFVTDYFAEIAHQFRICRKPLIAAVSGYALGGGCELAMLCDIIIAADTAKFGLPEVTLGIIPAMGGTQRLIRAVGKAKAMDMLLTGRFISADEAERSGLVARVVPADRLVEEARAMAHKVAARSHLAALAVKESADRSFETTLSEGLLHERRLFHALFGTEDKHEGMAAFLEKRAPVFRDR